MDKYPEITAVTNSLVDVLQGIGAAIFVVCIAMVALMVMTSFGNEHRTAIAKSALVGLVIGLALLLGAHKASDLFLRVLK